MDIRYFEEKDQEAVIQLWKDCGLCVPWNDPIKDIGRKLEIQRELFLVGLDEEQIVAALMGGYDGHRGWVNYLAVHPDKQRRGLARELMSGLEELLIELGCPKINLQIRDSNVEVQNFYEAIGYQQDPVVSYGKRLIPDA